MDGDAIVTMNFLRGMLKNDALFLTRHKFDEDGRLEHLFWANGMLRVNFQCFRDVLTSDITYKINKYNPLFVIFFCCESP